MTRRTTPFYRSATLRMFSALICVAALQFAAVVYLHPSFSQTSSSRLLSVATSAKVSLTKNESTSFISPSFGGSFSRSFTPKKKDYDDAAPEFIENNIRCHFLPSIPPHRQTPPHLVSDARRFKESFSSVFEETNFLGKEDDRPLYVYNPSIVSLRHMDQVLQDEITGRNFDFKETGVQPLYLVIFRVSTASQCFGKGMDFPGDKSRSYLGLALLDRNLDIIDGTDIVTDINLWGRLLYYGDINQHLSWINEYTIKGKKYFAPKQHLEDCRLVVAAAMPHAPSNSTGPSGTERKQGLYISCNSYFIPIAVHRTPKTSDALPPSIDDIRQQGFSNANVIPNEFGDGLRLTYLDTQKQISDKNEKNFNVICAKPESSSLPEFYLQHRPGGPHEVRYIDFSPQSDDKLFFDPFKKNESIIASEFEEPNATWLEPDTFKRLDNFHVRDCGGACCVQITPPHLGGGRSLYVGATHTRTIKRGRMSIGGQYASRLYAYETEPPFKVVAKTGLFCLGFGKPEESRGNAHVGFNKDVLFHVSKRYNRTYQCPKVSFISGISEHATNSSLVILAYGVNDCYPRMGMIEKQELVTLLFPQFYPSRFLQ